MKKTLIYMFLLIYYFVNAQTPSRFPIKSTSEWRINFDEISAIPIWTGGEEEFRLFVENDTLIDTLTYYKLYKSGTAHYDTIFSYDHVYLGAIRDRDNKFFYIEKNTTKELILYDFDLSEDDTIYSEVEQNMVITSIEIQEDGRKKFNIYKTDFQHGECNNIFNSYLIEGIGSMGGLLYESPCEHIGFMEHFLLCYYENDTVVYHNSLSPISCDTANSIHQTDVLKVNFYPIPANEFITIESQGIKDRLTCIEIYDISGQNVIRKKITTNKTSINIRHLPQGIYFLKILSNYSSYSKKIVIK